MQIVYLNEDPPKRACGESRLFSALIDGHILSSFPRLGARRPKLRIEFPGNPILGERKWDNQNHALIFFYRGEYLLIDANRDNYLEECIEIRNALGEFEEFATPRKNPYSLGTAKEMTSPAVHVAIAGAREDVRPGDD